MSAPPPRASGLLLHLTSLPGPHGVGDLGPAAYRFVDFLVRAGQQLWQVLPLGPVDAGGSPYSSPSAFAGSPLLVSLERLCADGLLTHQESAPVQPFSDEAVDYERVLAFKRQALRRAFERFEARSPGELAQAFEDFCAAQASWLDDYALFMALKDAHGPAAWTTWPGGLTQFDPEAVSAARAEHAAAVRRHQFWQFLFARQWAALRAYAQARGVSFFGDVPIYVAHDSVDVWAHQALFHLDDEGQPTVVSGVPPDAFSETGQRWGQPLYRWGVMAENDFAWWKRRFRVALRTVDCVRLDHFRGFAAYWEIPASEPTAVNGHWVEGPGTAFFEAVRKDLGGLPFVAEDLGVITPDVEALREAVGLGGMAVLSFGLADGPGSTHIPHRYAPETTAYTGTHDNDTLAGWWAGLDAQKDDAADTRAFARQYLRLDEGAPVHWAAMHTLMTSVASRVIMPLQDVLGLGSAARMNTPGETADNWRWRFAPEQLSGEVADRLRALTKATGRLRSREDEEAATGDAATGDAASSEGASSKDAPDSSFARVTPTKEHA